LAADAEHLGFNIQVPAIPSLGDEALERLFGKWDGAWSSQTRFLMQQFKARGLDLNDSWASTPQLWICPCCARSKPQLVRLSPTGILLCHLDWHHDHLRDKGKAILRARNPRVVGPEGLPVARAIDICKELVERFYTVLVCEDCNTAEGAAKTALRRQVHPDFSFSPAEIASFIKVSPNAPHGLDLAAAEAAWNAAKPEFESLLAFAELLADRVASGHHRKSGVPPRFSVGPTNDAILHSLAVEAGGTRAYYLTSHLAERSIRRDGSHSAPAKPRRPAKAPTDEEFASFSAKQDPRSLWCRAPTDWKCAACARDRRAIMRQSNKGVWTGQLHRFHDFQVETDPMSLWYRDVDDVDELVFGDHVTFIICGDCRHLITDVKTRDPGLTEDCWTLSDLKALVAGAAPNVRHDIPLETALSCAKANLDRLPAVAAYYKHRSEALNVRADIARIQRRDRCSVEEALFTLAWSEQFSREENSEWEDRLRWLQYESERFAGNELLA